MENCLQLNGGSQQADLKCGFKDQTTVLLWNKVQILGGEKPQDAVGSTRLTYVSLLAEQTVHKYADFNQPDKA